MQWKMSELENNAMGRDLWRSLVQPPDQSRDNFQVISGCSRPCPALLKISKDGDFVRSLDNGG